MDKKQEKALKDKLTNLGYPDFALQIDEDEEVIMLYIDNRLICGALYALSMPDEALKALIDETVEVA
jgi:hypothetical protein